VFIAHNLRHDVLGDLVTPEWLGQPGAPATDANGLHPELAFLHRFALARKAEREIVRGKPENFNRPDYNFKLDKAPGTEPQGHEPVHITVRPRGEPLDLIVAECMIVANHQWGQRLADSGLPGIYRSQHSLAPGMKVRMGTRALAHAGIGVPCYAWSTSPLRRYTDMVNQWQIIASVQHGATAALVAPFKPKDAALLGIIGAFDAAYASYNAVQNDMERFWTLRYIAQNGLESLEATVIKDMPDVTLRAADLPLVFGLGASTGTGLARGQRVRVAVRGLDLMALELHASLLERLDDAALEAQVDPDDAEELDSSPKTLAIALDVDEPVPTT
jgi:exoribonuclease II